MQIARERGVDYLCCETGLGGRLDASNALPAIATLLTSVGLDHQRILGDTLPAIAAEKLGLLKRGVPLFAAVADELRGQTFTAAVTAGSPCFFVDELARWPETAAAVAGWDLALRQEMITGLPDFGTPVMRRNVALALLALSELSAGADRALLPPDPAAALGNLFLPGRYQPVLRNPTWIFDTAHNAQALTQALQAFGRSGAGGRRVILYGGMQDKSVPPELGRLLGGCDHLVGLPVSLPRARTSAELESLFAELGLAPGGPDGLWLDQCTVAADMASGLQAVAAGLRPDDQVLVTGSCFMVAEVLHRLGVTDLQQTRKVLDAVRVMERLAVGNRVPGKEGP